MIFNLRPIIESDYEDILLGWWKSWGFSAPPKDFLPDNGTGGIMVLDGDIPVCAGFLYTTNSKVVWVDWIVSNKEYRKKPHRKNGLNLLIQTLTNTAKDEKYKYVYANNNNTYLIDAFLSNGYLKGSKSTELIKNI
jgi:hypothetical protein